MITVKADRTVYIPASERHIGFENDNLTTRRLFEICDESLAEFNFKLDIKNTLDIIDLQKEISDGGRIILTWDITSNVIGEAGIISAQLRAFDESGQKVWHSSVMEFVSEPSVNAQKEANQERIITEFEQLEIQVQNLVNQAEQASENALSSEDAARQICTEVLAAKQEFDEVFSGATNISEMIESHCENLDNPHCLKAHQIGALDKKTIQAEQIDRPENINDCEVLFYTNDGLTYKSAPFEKALIFTSSTEESTFVQTAVSITGHIYTRYITSKDDNVSLQVDWTLKSNSCDDIDTRFEAVQQEFNEAGKALSELKNDMEDFTYGLGNIQLPSYAYIEELCGYCYKGVSILDENTTVVSGSGFSIKVRVPKGVNGQASVSVKNADGDSVIIKEGSTETVLNLGETLIKKLQVMPRSYNEDVYFEILSEGTSNIEIGGINVDFRWDKLIQEVRSVDKQLDESSQNPVENRVVSAVLRDIGGAVENKVSKSEIKSKNLFNVATLSDSGQCCNSITGEIEYMSDYCTSDYIPIVPGENYCYSGGAKNGISISSTVFFDAEKKYVIGTPYGDSNTTYMKFKAPQNAHYVIINFPNRQTALTNVQLERGEKPTAYEEYKEYFSIEGLKVEPQQLVYSNKTIITLAPKYELVVGDTFELFYQGIIECKNLSTYNITASCDIGQSDQRKYTVTPTQAGSYILSIKITDATGRMIDFQRTILSVKAKKTRPSKRVNILCVGDDMTLDGTWVDELCRRITKTTSVTASGEAAPTGDGISNIYFIGKQTTKENSAGYEAMVAGEISDYISVDEGSASPFLYNGEIDFSAYCDEIGCSSIDYCYIFIGINSINKDLDTYKSDLQSFIKKLYSFNKRIKIGIVGLQMPNDAGSAECSEQASALRQRVFELNEMYKSMVSSYVFYIDIAAQFDTQFNMQKVSCSPNVRNNTSTITTDSTQLWPLQQGFYQIADAIYRSFNNN